MSNNELAALALLAMWLFSTKTTGRGLNLCAVIFFYYVAYLVTRPYLTDPKIYYAVQMALDSTIIAVACAISHKYKIFRMLPIGYAFIVLTSLICEALKFIDESGQFYLLSDLHRFRQTFSIPLDILFAGSDVAIVYLLRHCGSTGPAVRPSDMADMGG